MNLVVFGGANFFDDKNSVLHMYTPAALNPPLDDEFLLPRAVD